MPVRRKKGKKGPAKNANPYKMPPPFPSGEVLKDSTGKQWRLGPSIGVGGFGEIYSACEHETTPVEDNTYPCVIKIEPIENGPLFVEMHFYIRNHKKESIAEFMASRGLSTFGMPEFHGTGEHVFEGEEFRFIVLDKYGTDLKKIFQEAGAFKMSTGFQLGLQLLDVLEYIHKRSYVHADIKSANILLGVKEGAENQVYLVDYGLAEKVLDEDFQPDPKCAHNGTIEYTSTDAHLGEPTYRGDLEILGYNILHWVTGSLPWGPHTEKLHKVHLMKKDLLKNARDRISTDYPDVPEALIQFFEYITTLQPKDVPEHAICRKVFEDYLQSVGVTRDTKLDLTPSEKGLSIKAAEAKIEDTDKKVIETIPSSSKAENGDEKEPSANPTPEELDSDIDNTTAGAKPAEVGSDVDKSVEMGSDVEASANNDSVESQNVDSDDDEPLKAKSEAPKSKRSRKRRSNEKNEAKTKKVKEPPKMSLIDTPAVRRLRSWVKRDEMIRALK